MEVPVPFPELTVIRLFSDGETPVIPGSFLGGSAPRLQIFTLLLLSADHLVQLRLFDIPHSVYISPSLPFSPPPIVHSLSDTFMSIGAGFGNRTSDTFMPRGRRGSSFVREGVVPVQQKCDIKSRPFQLPHPLLLQFRSSSFALPLLTRFNPLRGPVCRPNAARFVHARPLRLAAFRATHDLCLQRSTLAEGTYAWAHIRDAGKRGCSLLLL